MGLRPRCYELFLLFIIFLIFLHGWLEEEQDTLSIALVYTNTV